MSGDFTEVCGGETEERGLNGTRDSDYTELTGARIESATATGRSENSM